MPVYLVFLGGGMGGGVVRRGYAGHKAGLID